MYYSKFESNGVLRKIELDGENTFTTCGKCGKEMFVDFEGLQDAIDNDVTMYCSECWPQVLAELNL